MDREIRLQALQNQINLLSIRSKKLEKISYRLSWMRLAIIMLGVLISGIVFFLGFATFLWLPLLVTLLLFVVVVVYHRRLDTHLDRYSIWMSIKKSQIARIRLDWENLRPSSSKPASSLELDLDLTGPYSLHRLLDTAVSSGGRQRLASWLNTPILDPEISRHRQRLVRELAPMSLFRGKLILYGVQAGSQGSGWQPEQMITWLRNHTIPGWLYRWVLLLGLLATLNISLLILNLAGWIPPLWQGTFLVYAILFLIRSPFTGEPFHEALQMRDALEQLLTVFGYLENYSYHKKPFLRELCAPFLASANRPTAHLKRINRVVNATGIRSNPLFWLILNALVPWDYYFTYQLAKSKATIAQYLPGWLDAWYELEALSSLANNAYLNPAYTFPSIKEFEPDNLEPVFQARQIGHPLIPSGERICNDFMIDKLGDVDLFTGSNMSGKSTFLRTVGINVVLAHAGGVVCAEFLETIPWRLYSCIKITDSVTDGISYFYAEVKCLKKLLETLGQPDSLPLLFLIDEIFRGTNNRERLQGSRAYIQAVAGKNGVGLVATHDLELIQLEDEVRQVQNYHFRDNISEGRMVFDYMLYPGPSPTTNAIKIMRAEGLPV